MRSKLIFIVLAALLVATITNIVSADPLHFGNFTILGDDSTDALYDISSTSDGGFIAVGTTYKFGGDKQNVWLVKLNSAGQVEWADDFGESWTNDCGYSVVESASGNYVIAGYSQDAAGQINIASIWWYLNGMVTWSQTYNVGHWGEFYSIKKTLDGNLIACGRTDVPSYLSQAYVVKVNDTGQVLFQNIFGGVAPDEARDVVLAGVGTNAYYFLAGSSSGIAKIWKLNYLGSLIDEGTYDFGIAKAIVHTPDGFLVTGQISSGTNPQLRMLKTDDNLQLVSSRAYLDTGEGNDLINDGQGNYIIVGAGIFEGYPGFRACAMGVNMAGDSLWTASLMQSGGSIYGNAIATNNEKYFVAGDIFSSLVNFESDGFIAELVEYQPQIWLIPQSLNIQIPNYGGSFNYDLMLHNPTDEFKLVDLWFDVTMPGGTVIPIMERNNITLEPWGFITRQDMTLYVPGSAPPGEYLFVAHLRLHNTWTVISTSSIPFTKVTGGGDNEKSIESWKLEGWDEEPVAIQPNGVKIYASPNPFNPTTTINYALPNSGNVILRVYDINGRQVAELVNGNREAGTHSVTFDGSALTSGIYLYRLEENNQATSGKMMLIK